MIPPTSLYDEYIDRPKLTEQKNPFDYIVPPPQVGRNNYTSTTQFEKSYAGSKM